MTGFINTFLYNLSQSQSITALPLVYPLHKSQGHAPFSFSFFSVLRCTPSYSESELELLYDWRFAANQFILASSPLRLTTSNFFKWILAFVVLMQHPLWGEDGSVVYNCCWSSSAQSLSGPTPAGLVTIFYCLKFETPQPSGPDPRIYITQKHGGPVIPPDIGFPFYRLLLLVGLLWRHSNPPPHGSVLLSSPLYSKSKSKSHCDWRSVNQ
jgi:hypothetical protein